MIEFHSTCVNLKGEELNENHAINGAKLPLPRVVLSYVVPETS